MKVAILDLPLLNYNKGVITLKRGKEVIREIENNPVLEENIINLWESLKKMGSAKTIMSRDYLGTKTISSFATETGFTTEEVTDIVRQESAERYSSLYDDVDDLDSGKVIDEIDELAGPYRTAASRLGRRGRRPLQSGSFITFSRAIPTTINERHRCRDTPPGVSEGPMFDDPDTRGRVSLLL